jgi:hypothetical protein
MNKPKVFDFRQWFDDLLPKLIKVSQAIMDTGEEVTPMLLIYGHKENQLVPVAIPQFGDTDSKNLVAGLQKSLAEDVVNVAGVVFISEIWTVRSDHKGAQEELDKYLKEHSGITEHPDRTEAVMINAMHGSEQLMAICDFDEKKKLAEPRIMSNRDKGWHASGRMVLDPPTEN